MEQIGAKIQAVHADGDRFGNVAGQNFGFERKALFGANRGIVARDDPARLEDFLETGNDIAEGGIHALIERLYNQVAGIAVDHEGGEEVGFTMYHAVGVGVMDDAAAALFGYAEAG